MFSFLFPKSDSVYIAYKLKQKDIDTIIEETTKRKLKKRLKQIKSSGYINGKIVYDTNINNVIRKFYK